MKKLLALLMVVATLFCIAACGDDTTADTTTTTKNDTATTTVANDETTTVANNGDETTTVANGDETTTVANGEETTTVAGDTTTTTKKGDATTTTTVPTTVTTTEHEGIKGVAPYNKNNQNKVVNGVFTSSNGGIQIEAEGWKTYNLYSISFVPQSYTNVGQTNAVCVAVYPKGSDGYDSQTVFENKTQKDFEDALQTGINSFEKTTISSNGKTYTCYKAVVTDTYYVWVFQTPEAKYFINFMQAPLDNGGWAFASEAAAMMATIQIYK